MAALWACYLPVQRKPFIIFVSIPLNSSNYPLQQILTLSVLSNHQAKCAHGRIPTSSTHLLKACVKWDPEEEYVRDSLEVEDDTVYERLFSGVSTVLSIYLLIAVMYVNPVHTELKPIFHNCAEWTGIRNRRELWLCTKQP